ncbi:cell division topological specificity factor MinE [Heliobacterium chlorum]|uniref:Cell division topological specificity factor MinE n=1 Tax=Heliobacterium chlorum TaxID=2698 RepID=A0ABR7T9W3_HELCL|nr:cell division topological specificity factor MinE [Heliobacterium chlorum]MBC9786561.1 cell division topological specificity factor MinE [Heliobacterium chlorum]
MNNFIKSTDLSGESNQLILVIDDKDAEVTPQMVKSLTEDMIQVIAKHIQIDRSKVKINLTSEQSVKKIVIYIPVVNIPRGK